MLERACVLVIDATSATELSCYGGTPGVTPNLDALAARGLRFERAASNANWTLPSTTSLMTGLVPELHGVVTKEHRATPDQPFLAELFADAGYRTAGFSQMAYASPSFDFDRGFESFRYDGMRSGNDPEETDERAASWVGEHAQEDWFLYVHLRRPHSPYDSSVQAYLRVVRGSPVAGFPDHELRSADTFGMRELRPAVRERIGELYRASLATQDEDLRPLLAALDAAGALVVFTSDHGEALGADGGYGHGLWTRHDNVHVPLVFAGPGVRRGTDDGPAFTVDLMPTLAELFGLDVRAGGQLSGTSLVDRLRRRAASNERDVTSIGKVLDGEATDVAVFSGEFKLVRARGGASSLFDIARDPLERRDLAAERVDVVERLAPVAARAAGLASAAAALAPTAERTTDEIEADLRALGYADDEP